MKYLQKSAALAAVANAFYYEDSMFTPNQTPMEIREVWQDSSK